MRSTIALAATLAVLCACDTRPTENPPDAGPGVVGPTTCAEACAPFASCEYLSPDDCVAACDQAGTASKEFACLVEVTQCGRASACVGLTQPFSTGVYGTKTGDIAAPFTLPTTDGDWSFEENWTGAESYVFAIRAGGYTYSDTLFTSSAVALLRASPPNVHYFFGSYEDSDGVDRVAQNVEAIRASFESALAALPSDDQDRWRPRLHFITQHAQTLSNWIGTALSSRAVFAFAIDRFQRIREVGMLLPPHSDLAKLQYLSHEPRHFNFEWDRDRRLARTPATLVTVFDRTDAPGDPANDPAKNDFFADVALPSAAAFAAFDTMEFDLTMGCPGENEESCAPGDTGAALYLCDVAEPATCNTEIGRWITTYGRAARWVTDVSGMMPFLADGGTRRMRFNTVQHYVLTLTIRLSNQGRGMRPVEVQKLPWPGGAFNETYSANQPTATFTVPEGVKKVELFLFLSGHGWGIEAANCAEFCNHEHHFRVNGTDFQKTHPTAGSATGCLERIEEGVTPNQWGTWPFGRGGWCPGLDVAPFNPDITGALVSGENTITYEGLFNGQPYVPQDANPPNPSGMHAFIWLSPYVVFWR